MKLIKYWVLVFTFFNVYSKRNVSFASNLESTVLEYCSGSELEVYNQVVGVETQDFCYTIEYSGPEKLSENRLSPILNYIASQPDLLKLGIKKIKILNSLTA